MTAPEPGEEDGARARTAHERAGERPRTGGDARERASEGSPRDEFDWRGWTLVGAIVVSFLLIPGLVLLFPHVGPAFGLTFRDAYLVLPLVPSVALAVLAVWAAVRRRQ